MKKLINYSFFYIFAGLAGGVFYREFTKFSGFSGKSSLGLVHTHLLLLGGIVFLLLALFAALLPLENQKTYRGFLIVYQGGLILTSIMLTVRGIFQVKGTELSGGADAAISGIAGLGHIFLGIGFILLFLTLRRAAAEKNNRS